MKKERIDKLITSLKLTPSVLEKHCADNKRRNHRQNNSAEISTDKELLMRKTLLSKHTERTSLSGQWLRTPPADAGTQFSSWLGRSPVLWAASPRPSAGGSVSWDGSPTAAQCRSRLRD